MHEKTLPQAAKSGDLEALQAHLLADPKPGQDEIDWALYYAAENEHLATVQILLDNEDPKPDQDGINIALEGAAENGHTEIVQALLANDDLKPDQNTIYWALRNAALNGRLATVQTLLNNQDPKPNQDAINKALYLAARNGHLATVQILLSAGADINRKGHDSKTVLETAIESGEKDVINVLLRSGAQLPEGNKFLSMISQTISRYMPSKLKSLLPERKTLENLTEGRNFSEDALQRLDAAHQEGQNRKQDYVDHFTENKFFDALKTGIIQPRAEDKIFQMALQAWKQSHDGAFPHETAQQTFGNEAIALKVQAMDGSSTSIEGLTGASTIHEVNAQLAEQPGRNPSENSLLIQGVSNPLTNDIRLCYMLKEDQATELTLFSLPKAPGNHSDKDNSDNNQELAGNIKRNQMSRSLQGKERDLLTREEKQSILFKNLTPREKEYVLNRLTPPPSAMLQQATPQAGGGIPQEKQAKRFDPKNS